VKKIPSHHPSHPKLDEEVRERGASSLQPPTSNL